MKKINLVQLLFLFIVGCVQPAYYKTVVVLLRVDGIKNIQTVGIRGEGSPLSWTEDLLLKPIVKDSLYTLTKTVYTAYSFTDIKFTVNGKFELENQPNRRLLFSNMDTTFYYAVFNQNIKL